MLCVLMLQFGLEIPVGQAVVLQLRHLLLQVAHLRGELERSDHIFIWVTPRATAGSHLSITITITSTEGEHLRLRGQSP